MSIDLHALWDFSRPEASEQRFREALAGASGDEALVLQTQIARTYGLRREFAQARELLERIADEVSIAGSEARAWHALESGRTHASAAHPHEEQTPEARAQARIHFQRSLDIAREHGHDALVIDALHMFAFLDTDPEDQLRLAHAALEVAEGSHDPAAKRWEASLRNNAGHALHQQGRFDEALIEFEQALALRERAGDASATRVAKWMVAWTMRSLGRSHEALAQQLQLAQACEAAGEPDPYVFEELEILYREAGDVDRAAEAAARRQALSR